MKLGQDFNGKRAPTYPMRIVLNPKTLTLFSSSDLENIYKSYDLRYLSV